MSSKTRSIEARVNASRNRRQTNSNRLSLRSERAAERSIQRERIFEILSNERRRLSLRYLRRHREDDRVRFRDLVDQVAAWENDTSVDRLDSSDRKCVYTALRQTHLPKLDSFGVIDFDHQRGSIEPNESIEDVLLYMRYVPEREIFWSRLYLLLAALCGICALLLWGGIVPFEGVSGLAVAIGIAVSFGVFSTVQIYQSHRGGLKHGEPDWS